MKYIFLFVGQLLLSYAYPQESPRSYNKALTYSLDIYNRGALIKGNWAWGEKEWKMTLGLAIGSLRGAKELRMRTQFMDLKEGSRYVPDKMNRCTFINPTLGFTKAIFPRSSYNKIETRAGFSGGLALAMLRPYYLNVLVPNPTNSNATLVKEQIADADKYSYSTVVGEVNPFFNMATKSLYPGLSLQAFSYLNLNRRSNFIRGIELSLSAYIFPKKIPIMQHSSNANTIFTVGMGFTQGHLF